MLSKSIELNSYTIQFDGVCFVEKYNIIKEDGSILSQVKHRDVYYPSNPIPDTGFDEVNALLKSKWTSDVVNAYEAKMAD